MATILRFEIASSEGKDLLHVELDTANPDLISIGVSNQDDATQQYCIVTRDELHRILDLIDIYRKNLKG